MPLCFYVEKKLEVEKQLGDCEGLRYIFIRIAFFKLGMNLKLYNVVNSKLWILHFKFAVTISAF